MDEARTEGADPVEERKPELRAFLEAELDAAELPEDGAKADLELEPLEGGRANDTRLLRWGDRTLVLRRTPPDDAAPAILHGRGREARVLSALEETGVPAPRLLAACTDPDVLGTPFLVMEHLEGEVLEAREPERFAVPRHRERLAHETVDVLARIHHVDPGAAGLADLDPEPETPARQLERVRDQLAWAADRTDDRRPVPRVREVADRLGGDVPEPAEAVLLHGDYKPDNLLFAPGTPPRLAGALDWEMAALGDPRLDLGWLLSYWHHPDDPSPVAGDLRERVEDHPVGPMIEAHVETYARFTEREGYPRRRELLARYERQTGRGLPRDRWYRAMAVLKLAAICEGFFRLHLEDAPGAKDVYAAMELLVPVLGQRALHVLDGEEPL